MLPDWTDADDFHFTSFHNDDTRSRATIKQALGTSVATKIFSFFTSVCMGHSPVWSRDSFVSGRIKNKFS